MQENRNTSFCTNGGGGTVIDTMRVLDCCRDRDCFEDVKVYLTQCGEAALQNSANLRTRSASILCAEVNVSEVPFNNGFYQVVVRYYIEIEFEICVCGKSQTVKGLSVVEKDVILYGGEGRAISFKSGNGGFCAPCCLNSGASNDPVAIAETVEPIVLGTKVSDCNCPCTCVCNDLIEIPETVEELFGGALVTNGTGPAITVSLGIFSVIRIVRPAQLLIQASDYSVPDKECSPASNNDNPCALFRTMPFPTSQFRGTDTKPELNSGRGGCGCKG